MRKSNVAFFAAGALMFGTLGVFAGQYTATENPFPIQLNGENISLKGYNIEGSTYFKLRDIADAVGGFKVDFNNDTIQLSKDGYEYGGNAVGKLAFTEKMSKDFSEYCMRLPEFTQESLSSEEFVENFIFYYYTGKGEVNSSSYHDGYFDWSEDSVKQDYKLLFGADMPEYHKSYGESVIYNNGTYEIAASNFGDESYNLIDIEADNDTITAVYQISDFENNDYGTVTLKAVAANNENGYVLVSKVKN